MYWLRFRGQLKSTLLGGQPTAFRSARFRQSLYSKASVSHFRYARPLKNWISYVLLFGIGFGASTLYCAFSDQASPAALDQAVFSPFTLISKEQVSSTSSIFTLVSARSTSQSLGLDKLWRLGVWSIQAKQPQLQIARSYTPLPPWSDQSPRETGAEVLRVLIRHEVNGEVSGYLHRLPLGATIDLRGPNMEYTLPEDVNEILFLAGGTGIAPGLQVAQALVDRMTERGTRAKMRILWANRKRGLSGRLQQVVKQCRFRAMVSSRHVAWSWTEKY